MIDLPRSKFAGCPLLVLATVFAAGILITRGRQFDSSKSLIIELILIAILLILSLRFRNRRPALATIALISTFAVTGVAIATISDRDAPNRLARMFDQAIIKSGDPIELTGTIEGQPETAPDGLFFHVKVDRLRVKGVELSASGMVGLFAHLSSEPLKSQYRSLGLRHGARLRLLTTLDREDEFRNPGMLPLTEYLARKGYDATGVIKSPLLIERLDDAPVFLPAWLYDWREQLQLRFHRLFSPETAGVLDAALLGNHYNVSRAAAERFRAGGTFHVLVISGLQIAFIGGVALMVVRWFVRNRLFQFLIAASFLWAYAIAVGADVSVVRAAFMFTILVLAPVLSRPVNTLNSLGGAAIALLVWRPNDLFDPSFQLTFLSVLSIVTIAVPLIKRMEQVGSWRPTFDTPYPPDCPRWFRTLAETLFWSERRWRAEMDNSNIRYRLCKSRLAIWLEQWRVQRVLRFAASALIVSAGVQVGMLPMLVIYFHRVSFASLWLNIFVGVLMAVVALIALLGTLISLVSFDLAAPLSVVAEKINWLMIHLVDPFSQWGLDSMRLPHYRGWLAGIYALYFLALGLLLTALARWNPLQLKTETKAGVLNRKLVRTLAAAFSGLLLIVVLHPGAEVRPDGNLQVDFLDVGQGDCALVTMPDGTTLLIDGGGRPNIDWKKSEDGSADETIERDSRSIGERVVSEFLWARGLHGVDYVLATHADADHIDGLNDVARNFRVRAALVARTPLNDQGFTRFAETMKQMQIPVQVIGEGDELRFGPVAVGVLWPKAVDASAASRNNDSLVLRMVFGDQVVLFTGDIEKEAEYALLSRGFDLRSNVVKVAHHGSKTSSTGSFISATRSGIAIISVGRSSIFGHPHKEVVARWRESGAQVMTTGEKGTITVVTDGRKLRLSTFVGQ